MGLEECAIRLFYVEKRHGEYAVLKHGSRAEFGRYAERPEAHDRAVALDISEARKAVLVAPVDVPAPVAIAPDAGVDTFAEPQKSRGKR